MGKAHQLSRTQKITKCFYDKDNGTILTRTPKSWGQIFLFYLVAYLFLAGFFMGMLHVFLYGYVPADIPALTGMQSLLKLTPGMVFEPQLSTSITFFHLTTFASSINDPYLEGARKLLASYGPSNWTAPCPNGRVGREFPQKPCVFPIESLGPCAKPEESLSAGLPCIYLRLNRVFGWLPNMSNETFSQIAIRCSGQNEVATFQLQEPEYFPNYVAPDGKQSAGMPTTYFPFIRQQGYQPPLVAVRFPKMMNNAVILVECKVYGLKYVDSFVQFELVVDSKT